MIRITPPHDYFRPDHLAHVTAEMKVRGAPRIKAYYDCEAGIWHAQEGTHRLRAAKFLGIAPVLLPIPWPRTQAALVRARYRWERHGHIFECAEVQVTDSSLSNVLLQLRAEDGPAAALVYSPGAPGGYEVWNIDPDGTLPPDEREATIRRRVKP